jgi:hypothetical protein
MHAHETHHGQQNIHPLVDLEVEEDKREGLLTSAWAQGHTRKDTSQSRVTMDRDRRTCPIGRFT